MASNISPEIRRKLEEDMAKAKNDSILDLSTGEIYEFVEGTKIKMLRYLQAKE